MKKKLKILLLIVFMLSCKKASAGLYSNIEDGIKAFKKNDFSNNSNNLKQVWADTMEKYSTKLEDSWYDIPKNVIGVLINPLDGKLATIDSKKKTIMYYIKGTEPD